MNNVQITVNYELNGKRFNYQTEWEVSSHLKELETDYKTEEEWRKSLLEIASTILKAESKMTLEDYVAHLKGGKI